MDRRVAITAVSLAFVAGSACLGPASPQAAGPHVRVTLDGGLLEEVVLTPDAPVALPTLLPAGLAWADVRQVIATTDDATHLGVRNPTIRHAGARFELSLDAQQQPTFTITPPPVDGLSPETAAARAASGPRLLGVTSVALYVAPPPPPVDDIAGEPLHLEVSGVGPIVFTARQLDAFARSADPRGRTDGWSLAQVVGSVAPAKPITGLTVVPAEGAPIALPSPDDRTLYIVKYNQTGELRIQRWLRTSDAPRPDAVYSDIARLRVTLGPG